jgi:GxxExxY protein
MIVEKNKTISRQELDALSKEVVDACVTVHKIMGPGLLESVYELCLFKELELRNLKVISQKVIPLSYKNFELSKDYKIDLLVEEEIIVELKAVEEVLPVHEAQMISYLKLADKRLGFLVNFNVPLMKYGIKRFVNNF